MFCTTLELNALGQWCSPVGPRGLALPPPNPWMPGLGAEGLIPLPISITLAHPCTLFQITTSNIDFLFTPTVEPNLFPVFQWFCFFTNPKHLANSTKLLYRWEALSPPLLACRIWLVWSCLPWSGARQGSLALHLHIHFWRVPGSVTRPPGSSIK